jgi:hypothetical protein
VAHVDRSATGRASVRCVCKDIVAVQVVFRDGNGRKISGILGRMVL